MSISFILYPNISYSLISSVISELFCDATPKAIASVSFLFLHVQLYPHVHISILLLSVTLLTREFHSPTGPTTSLYCVSFFTFHVPYLRCSYALIAHFEDPEASRCPPLSPEPMNPIQMLCYEYCGQYSRFTESALSALAPRQV